MTRLLRKLRELVSDVWSAITAPYWNPYGGQARERAQLVACIVCGNDLPPASERAVCEECRILAREGYVRPEIPNRRGVDFDVRMTPSDKPSRKVVRGPWR